MFQIFNNIEYCYKTYLNKNNKGQNVYNHVMNKMY